MGVSKDGRAIYGPKRPGSGTTYSACELDVCNGKLVTPDGETSTVYAYFGTIHHPYIIGCWGPGNTPDDNLEEQDCSSNGRVCIPGESILGISKVSATLFGLLLALLIH